MNRYEKRKKAIERAMAEHVEGFQAIYAKAKADDDREPTDDERLEVEQHLRDIETLKVEREEVEANIKTIQHVDDLGREIGPVLDTRVVSEPHDRLFGAIEHALPVGNGYG